MRGLEQQGHAWHCGRGRTSRSIIDTPLFLSGSYAVGSGQGTTGWVTDEDRIVVYLDYQYVMQVESTDSLFLSALGSGVKAGEESADSHLPMEEWKDCTNITLVSGFA